jgi:hypothetical protein
MRSVIVKLSPSLVIRERSVAAGGFSDAVSSWVVVDVVGAWLAGTGELKGCASPASVVADGRSVGAGLGFAPTLSDASAGCTDGFSVVDISMAMMTVLKNCSEMLKGGGWRAEVCLKRYHGGGK